MSLTLSFRSLAFSVLLISLTAKSAHAANYSFVKVIDSTTVTSAGTLGIYLGATVSGNRVAFLGFSGSGEAVGVGSGGLVTIVAKRGDPSPIGNLTYLGTGSIPSIEGTDVIFWAQTASSTGYFAGNGGPLTKVVATGDTTPNGVITNVDYSPFLNEGKVSFSGSHNNGVGLGVFVKDGGAITAIARQSDAPTGSFTRFDPPAQEGSKVAFGALYSGNAGLFIGNGGSLTTIVKSGDPAPVGTFNGFVMPFSLPSINNGVVLFSGHYDSQKSGIFQWNGGPLSTVLKTGDPAPSGTFASVSGGVMAGNTMAFTGTDDGGSGIFVRTNGVILSVIRVGDPLFGSTITNLSFAREGFDRSGTQNLAFGYQLQDGRRGIVLALHIPEPATLAICAFVAAFCFLRRHRRHL